MRGWEVGVEVKLVELGVLLQTGLRSVLEPKGIGPLLTVQPDHSYLT